MPTSRVRKPEAVRRGRRPKSQRHGQPPDFTDGGIYTLTNLTPEQVVEVGLPVWWLMLRQGDPTNACLDGALMLRSAFAQFGVVAEPKFVVLSVQERSSGRVTEYGTTEPRIEGEHLRNGHAGLWLPSSGRFIDLTAQQFPEIRAESWMPVVVPLAASGVTQWGQVSPVVPRGDLLLTYGPLPESVNDEILRHPRLAEFADQHHRQGVNVASSFLQTLQLDDVRDVVRAVPHPRLHALLAAVGDAAVVADEQGNARFLLPGTEDRGGLYLDEIPVGG